MNLVIFGLTVSSSWGNGHATIWRGLCGALARAGHRITFFEKDVPYYARHRDFSEARDYQLVFYQEWVDLEVRAREAVKKSDCAIVTSYCPDARVAAELMLAEAGGLRVFYDLDTPITLERLRRGEDVEYVPPHGLGSFDLVLSYTGGRALEELKSRLGAKRVSPLYGSADPNSHQPVEPSVQYRSDLSYLGTYASDRQEQLQRLFLQPARQFPEKKFLIGGALYPNDFPWSENVFFVPHVPPLEHPAFYSSSKLTLSVTRGAMAEMGYCPSGRLFEAGACATVVISDDWKGLDTFFEPGREILIAPDSADVAKALAFDEETLHSIGGAARKRVLAEHTAGHRAADLVSLLEAAA
jgi:spore maturation protein CgeB